MKLRLTLQRPGGTSADIAVTVDATATIGSIAEAIALCDPARGNLAMPTSPTLSVLRHGSLPLELSPAAVVPDSGLKSGDAVSVTASAEQALNQRSTGQPAATMTIIAGPDAGKQFPLSLGSNIVGRDRTCEVVLTDPLVSKQHARVNVGDSVELLDLNSSNGIVVASDLVQRVVVKADDAVTLGDTTLSVTLHANTSAGAGDTATTVEFNRSPHLQPPYEPATLVAPEPPEPPTRAPFPVIPLIAPIFLGAMLYLITRSVASLAFVAFSPVLAIGAALENRMQGKKAYARALVVFGEQLAELSSQLGRAHDDERRMRSAENPSAYELGDAAARLTPLLWSRRPDRELFGVVRLGLGRRPARTAIEMPRANTAAAHLWADLHAVVDANRFVDAVPVEVDFSECGSLGIAGPSTSSASVARSVMTSMIAAHSPADVAVLAVTSATSAPRWNWLKWLPHVGSAHSPVAGDQLACSANGATGLVAALEDLVDRRAAERSRENARALPAVLLLVENDAPVERSRLVELAELGPAQSVHVMWVAPSVEQLPAACRVFADVAEDPSHGSIGLVAEGRKVEPAAFDPVDLAAAEILARRLAPVVDAGARVDDESDLPRSVSFMSLSGRDVLDTSSAIVDRWRESHSLAPRDGSAPTRKHERTLRALVGQGASQALYLDLRQQGPHALVGGTTGSGKSEFLQSWILGMAAAHSPERVTFLLVDYKGGSAFADCVNLPHTVGLVTDLSPHLVRRALTSLDAELKHRERILQRHRAKDLLELERDGNPDAPPSLVIVVDEFAALVAEVPEFVDGVVNVAQRGRSLGLHLILATQRPAGVIKDNLRANTNLRVALRMADEADSLDVLGSNQAALFDPSIPGRAVAKTGPGRLARFQSAYAGGWTPKETPKPQILIEDLVFGVGERWQEPEDALPHIEAAAGPTDIRLIVDRVAAAAREAQVPAPRKPWLAPLASLYDLSRLPTPRTDDQLVFGVHDDPADQEQPVIAFHPDRDGGLVVYGTGGTGKTVFLRTIAVAAGLTARGGPCHVYGFDFAGRGLSLLEEMPHVGSVIAGSDHERITRCLRMLRELIDERAHRYAAVRAGTIADYRRLAKMPQEPRILLLIDNLGGFRSAYEATAHMRWFDQFLSVAADGRQVGVHLVVSADRPGAMPSALASVVQARLVLRLADDNDLAMVGAPTDGFDAGSPPGRGFLDGAEVQVAVLGGDASVVEQGIAIARLAESMTRVGMEVAPPIERLTERVPLADLPVTVNDRPALGLADETLSAVPFEPVGVMLVSGPGGSGRTTSFVTLATSLRRHIPHVELHYLGAGRSPSSALPLWTSIATTADEAADVAEELTKRLATGDAAPGKTAIFIESVADFLGGNADVALQDLLKTVRAVKAFAVVEGETASLTSSWPLLQAARSGAYGLALQPDQGDGSTLFKTNFPRVSRAEFPAGRGFLVSGGRFALVQVAMPE